MALVTTFNSFAAVFNENRPFIETAKPFIVRMLTDGTRKIEFTLVTDIDSVVINWGDGTQVTVNPSTTYNANKTYTTYGYKNVSFTANTIQTIRFKGDLATVTYITDVIQWGTVNFKSYDSMFKFCSTLSAITASDWPRYANGVSMANMFANVSVVTSSTFYDNLRNWRTGGVVNMDRMFQGTRIVSGTGTSGIAPNVITNWNTMNVTSMDFMFANSMFSGNIGGWDVSKVISMVGTFANTTAFNGNIGSWNTISVANTVTMFKSAELFNQNLNNWNVSNVTNMGSMFSDAIEFNQPLSNWNVSKVQNMPGMFSNAYSFNQPLNTWNVGNVTVMSSMFDFAQSFNQPLNTWNVSKVTSMTRMFANTLSFNGDISTWSTGNVTSTTYMFFASQAFNQSLNNWDVRKIPSGFHANGVYYTNMDGMFSDAIAMSGNISKWCVANIPTKPPGFDANTSTGWLTSLKPVWGTCPP